jgi:hydroxymethylpyrimidine pyrophosphatase-like HAD family hydrolase
MRYRALATDYDGTLAKDGHVDEPTLAALERLRASGRLLILVTGRELDELWTVCPRTGMFDMVVAENGAVVFRPSSRQETRLADPPPQALIASLRRRGVDPISVGRVIIATWAVHQAAVQGAVTELGLNWQLILNKRSLMVLPPGVDKATGLTAALSELGVSARETVAVGDAENDLAFLSLCGYSVAVANALPLIRGCVNLVTAGDHGQGIIELIDRILAEDIPDQAPPRR